MDTWRLSNWKHDADLGKIFKQTKNKNESWVGFHKPIYALRQALTLYTPFFRRTNLVLVLSPAIKHYEIHPWTLDRDQLIKCLMCCTSLKKVTDALQRGANIKQIWLLSILMYVSSTLESICFNINKFVFWLCRHSLNMLNIIHACLFSIKKIVPHLSKEKQKINIAIKLFCMRMKINENLSKYIFPNIFLLSSYFQIS